MKNRNDLFLVSLIGLNILFMMGFYLDLTVISFMVWMILYAALLIPLAFGNPKWIIPVLLITLPLEVSKAYIPILKFTAIRHEGIMHSILDASRITILMLMIIWLLLDPLFKKEKAKYTPFLFFIVSFTAYLIFSSLLITPAKGKAFVELFRFLVYVIMFLMILRFARSERAFKLIYQTLFVIGVIISIEGLLESAFNYHLWNWWLGERVNSTFADPNLYGRFLAVSIASTLVMRFKYRIFHTFYLDVGLFTMFTALILTMSRGSYLSLVAALFIFLFELDKKHRKYLFPILILAVGISITIFARLVASREVTNDLALYDIGQRIGLIAAGVQMFIDHPIFGVGYSGFGVVILEEYLELLLWGEVGDTLSHTYVITVLSELGIIGFILFTTLIVQIMRHYKAIKLQLSQDMNAYLSASYIAMIVIFISSQAAGRFFEDPFLWLSLGLFASIISIHKEEITP